MPDFKHILITGASSGIGEALAERYAAPGVLLSLYGRDTKRLDAVKQAVEQRGATVAVTACDVTEEANMKKRIEESDALQPIDLIIANAGISAGADRGHESAEQSRRIFATNVTGVLNTVHPVVPLMIKRGRGHIALVASLAGFFGVAGSASYSASKAAVRLYGEALRGELAPAGIGVSVICPGFIKTPMTDVNLFPMPFQMSADRAARIIQKGLAQNRPRIAFPWRMYMAVRIAAMLPQDLCTRLTSRLPRKPALQ